MAAIAASSRARVMLDCVGRHFSHLRGLSQRCRRRVKIDHGPLPPPCRFHTAGTPAGTARRLPETAQTPARRQNLPSLPHSRSPARKSPAAHAAAPPRSPHAPERFARPARRSASETKIIPKHNALPPQPIVCEGRRFLTRSAPVLQNLHILHIDAKSFR